MCYDHEKAKAQAEHSRQSPIYGTDFSKPLSQLIEDLRNEMTTTRGRISDIMFGYPGWKERVEHVSGLLTCGIVALANSKQEIFEHEIRQQDELHGESIHFGSRGIGLDIVPCCFVCGATKRNEEANAYLHNIAAFIDKADGDTLLGWFDGRAVVDFREREPNWVQFKFGACDTHKPNLQKLDGLVRYYRRIRKSMVEEALKFIPETEEPKC